MLYRYFVLRLQIQLILQVFDQIKFVLNCFKLSVYNMQKQTYSSVHQFVKITRKLLEQQKQQQMALFQQLTDKKSFTQMQTEGIALTHMMVINAKDGFYGRQILTIVKSYSSEKNPQNLPQQCKLQVGDDVAIYQHNSIIAQGVVHKRLSHKIKISLCKKQNRQEQDIQYQGRNVSIVLKWNQVTLLRYSAILTKIQQQPDHPLVKIFFNDHKIQPRKAQVYFNQKLNEQQNVAISKALVQEAHLIHGPPGTGKTKTACQLIVEAVKKGQKVLACAPSNIAVDNIVEGLHKKVSCVRVGNPARMIGQVLQRSLDFLVASNTNLWKNQVKKLATLKNKLSKTDLRPQRKKIFRQMKDIKNQIRSLQQQTIEQILVDSDVICCTNAGAGDSVFKKYLPKNKRTFDLVVIDECGQGLEVSCWIPLLRGRRAVLAGDHKQLPPTVKSQKQNCLLSYTLFSRAMEELPYVESTMLKVQYRMNQKIMGWSNKMFYNGQLRADKSVQFHDLKQLYARVQEDQQTIMMIDTAGCEMGEQGQQNGSKMNKGEADLVLSILVRIMGYGVQSKHIAVLTPYSKQVSLIRNLMQSSNAQEIRTQAASLPQVSTVDGIQGRQKQCIIISMVRSNPGKQIGFLKDWRRMNVAVTRARRMLIIIGDSDCASKDQNLDSLIKWIDEHGLRKSAMQFKGDGNIRFGQGKISDKNYVHAEKSNQESTKKNKKIKKEEQKTKNEKKQSNNNKQQHRAVKLQSHSLEQSNETKAKYKSLLINLVDRMTFKDLNSYERKMLHQVAEQLGLNHKTSDDKKQLVVWVIQKEQKKQQKIQQLADEQKKELPDKKNSDTKQAKQNTQNVKRNQKFTIQQLQIQSSQSEEEVPQHPKDQQQQKKQAQKEEDNKVKSKKSKKKKNKAKEQQTKQQDWQAILNQWSAQAPKKDECYQCHKKITSVTSSTCRFCGIFFCRYHVLAQEHGCDEEAKKQARQRQQINSTNALLKQGTQKLKQKLKEQQQKRKKKTSKK